jgi:Flp pilus assembly protein TadG
MKPRARIPADDLLADDSGTTLVEFAIVLPIFLLLFLGTIDFGRFGAEYMMAQKAMQLAARTAAVRA